MRTEGEAIATHAEDRCRGTGGLQKESGGTAFAGPHQTKDIELLLILLTLSLLYLLLPAIHSIQKFELFLIQSPVLACG